MRINRNLVSLSRLLHIYLSIALLVILVFFSVTGITLNHADFLAVDPETEIRDLDSLPALPRDERNRLLDSPELEEFLRREFGIERGLASLAFEEELLFIDYRAPGRTAFVEIDPYSEVAHAELSDYGFIATLNDLHKARDTDALWKLLVDLSAVLLVLFSLAGFILLLPNQYRLKRVSLYTLGATIILSTAYYLASP